MNSINEGLLPEHEKLKKGIIINDLKLFSDRIKELCQKHNTKALFPFAEQLIEHAENFDINNIESELKKFPLIIEKISNTENI